MLETAHVHCPYCGEPLELLIDPSADEQAYIEDCAVCCRPIRVTATLDVGGLFRVEVSRDDE